MAELVGGGAPELAGLAMQLAATPPEERAAVISRMAPHDILIMQHLWGFWARGEQLAPEGDWRTWLILAGRGWGKTRTGAEWVRAIARRRGPRRIALIAATMAEARSVMVEGESGLLGISPTRERPVFEPSLGRLSWTSGARGFLLSAAEPDSLRGPQFDAAWADEIGKWPKGEEAWANLMFALRLGGNPRIVATTTPRPVPLIRRLIETEDVAITRGTTHDNRAHLAPGFIAAIEAAYGGTRLGRQEIGGELIEDVEGTLWPRALIEACRVAEPPELVRVVVGVDPPASEGGDACGIVAAGLGSDGRGYELEDASEDGLRPEGWARRVAETATKWDADRVVAEANQGGAMVESVLRAAKRRLPLRLVHARRGKAVRAEPVAALYEQGEVAHAGAFARLEDELAGMTIGGGYQGPGRSPDRADALVWALTELMLNAAGRPGVRRL